MKVVACVPAFNEEGTIAKVVVRARRHSDVVVVVDDGSTDDTAPIAKALGSEVVSHRARMGYGAAIRSCFKAASAMGADVLVTLDADGQHNPDEMPTLLAPIRDGSADIVIGTRFSNAQISGEMPRYRAAGVRALTSLMDATSNTQLTDAQCGFRAYNRNAIERISPTEQGMGVSAEILMKSLEEKLRVLEVPVTVRYGELDTSSHNPIYHALDVIASIVKFTSIRHPLIFYGGMSAISASLAIAFGLWTLDVYQKEGRVVTNLALLTLGLGIVAVVALIAAVILFTLINVIREIPRELRRDSSGTMAVVDNNTSPSGDHSERPPQRAVNEPKYGIPTPTSRHAT